MKPIRLTMQAFGPYPGREVIDFRAALDAGLFGIYGQTGSGKSTIFSAMTFALFGQAARAEQETTSLRSDHAAPGVQTEVEFVFDIGARRYVLLRRPEQMRPKQRGDGETRLPHEAFLFDATGVAPEQIGEAHRGSILAEKKVRDVDAAVADLLGYGADQFRQIVLLPQGRFEKFLEAKTKERLEILRDLFDVSIYRSLAARLKSDAEAAERQVREERALCARRLAAEGFESTDALTAGIAEADEQHAKLLEAEQVAQKECRAAEEVLKAAEKVDELFATAARARVAQAELRAGIDEIEALAARVKQAERARLLLDTEANVADAAAGVAKAQAGLAVTRDAAARASESARKAADAAKREADRAGEIDELRRRRDDLGRHSEAVARAAGVAENVEQAARAELEAGGQLEAAERRLEGLQGDLRSRGDALKAARATEERRQQITARLSSLGALLTASKAYEQAESAVHRAQQEVAEMSAAHEAAARSAEETSERHEEAERNLSAAQALHLATKLLPGGPCPVCGATEHPAPATGAAEHAGRDEAFRKARAAWQDAEKVVRDAAQALAAAESRLKERRDRLGDLETPAEKAAALAAALQEEQSALDALGLQANIVEAETAIERLDEEVASARIARDELLTALHDRQRKAAECRARLGEMLSAVPEDLRDSDALDLARADALKQLGERVAAKESADKAAREARDALLSAQKDLEAADSILVDCQERHGRARDAFETRLAEAGLGEEEYLSLKPAIQTIEEDRAEVDEYRRKLRTAEETTKNSAEAVRDLVRPDLEVLEAARRDAEEKLSKATDLRAGAGHRLDHLTRLRHELAETQRRLDAAEAASGPLRALAALVNGENPQKLDLETFAIGAMFDGVLAAANLRLAPMTANRYRLERDVEGAGRGRRGLGIQAMDLHTGRPRPTSTLSGGETFIAALALALGLADVVESASGRVSLDTIFIDEGFGSLDSENGAGTLDQVLQVLSSLVSQNRAVGLISHVPLVQEAIPNGFYVRKGLSGSSVAARGLA